MIESFIFYKSFFKMAELITNPMEKFALYDAIIQYAINGTEPQFDESFLLARISWEGIKPQIDANTKRKYDGKKGGRPKEEIEKTSGYENKKPVVSEENNQWFPEEKTSGFENKKPNNNVNDNNNENNNDNENIDYPTKEKILQLAKDPSVALPPEEAEKFFDHYTAQSWTRSNGQAIPNTSPALISMLRMWKSNSVNFAPRQQTFSYGNQQPQKSRRERIDETIRNNRDCFIELFNCTESHYYGDYDNDPRTWDDWSYRENVLNKIENEGFSTQFKIYAKYRKEN